MQQADQIAASIGNLWGQGYCRMYAGPAYHDLGEPGKAIRVMQECLSLSSQAGFLAPNMITQSDLAVVYAELGAYQQGLACANSAFEAMTAWGGNWEHYSIYSKLLLLVFSGQIEQARSLTHRAIELRQEMFRYSESELLILIGLCECSLAQQDFQAVLEYAGQLEPFLQEGVNVVGPAILFWQAAALRGLGQLKEARSRMLESIQSAQELGQRRLLWRAQRGLAQIEARHGDASAAARCWAESAEVIRYIADRIDDPSLHAAFLNRLEVREVLDEAAKEIAN
jgi:tetratricopeptide (TPR) repeat protein